MSRLLSGLLLLLVSAPLEAQPTVAPSPEPVGRTRGNDAGNYNIVSTFETGYRSHSVDGNGQKYRSDVNFGNGIRLLGSNLTVNSKDGHGRLFDEIILTTQGLGNDPYQSASFRIQKNTWYRYDLLWRSNDYFNPGLASAAGGHLLDTRRQMQDHDFTLFPQSRFRIFAGFSKNSQTGPGLSTINLFDSLGDQFSYFANIDRRQREFRLGAEGQAAGFKIHIMHGWERYQESTAYQLNAPSAGANTVDRVTLNNLTRTEPYSGNTPFWRGSLLNDRKSWYAINARFSYAGSRRGFTFDEAIAGTSRSGSAATRQTLVTGTGTRPLSTGSLTLSLFPSTKWTITNHSAFHQTGMNGDASYREVNNAANTFSVIYFQNLSLRTLVNQTDASYQAARWLGVFTGYRYSNRRIQSVEAESSAFFSDQAGANQRNQLHAGSAGVRLQPVKPLSILLDTEIGRADRPFVNTSERNYQVFGGRVQYKSGPVRVQVFSRANYNTNSSSLFTHSARSRSSGLDASYSAKRWFSIDAGYSKQHWDTLTGLAYFASGDLVQNDASLYISNIHTGYLSVHGSWRQRVDLTLGYTRVQDTGDGRATPTSGSAGGSQLATFRAAQTFPLAFQSPIARLSVKLYDKIRWNVGYQFYGYREDFQTAQNYRAHTGFTSLIWSF
jgi:hypothetical protein